MISLTAIANGITHYTSQFFSDLTTAITVKALFAFCVAVLAYTVGVTSTPIFLALITLVLLEFLVHLMGHIHTAVKNRSWKNCWQDLEIIGLSTAVQLVVYGVLTSAGYLIDGIILNNSSFLESTVISFLAISEFIRIIKASSELGYSVPPFMLAMLHAYTGEGETIHNKK